MAISLTNLLCSPANVVGLAVRFRHIVGIGWTDYYLKYAPLTEKWAQVCRTGSYNPTGFEAGALRPTANAL